MSAKLEFMEGGYKVQGDVVLRPIKNLPEGAKLVKENAKILQQSETTGHHHQFKNDAQVDLYQVELPQDQMPTLTDNEGKIIDVKAPSMLFHGRAFDAEPAKTGTGDHNSMQIDPGLYYVDIVRVYDYDANEPARVVD